MSSSTLDYLYGPLNQKYCMYFYALSVIGFILLLSVVVYTVYSGLTAGKKLPIGFFMSMLMSALIYVFMYFQNRLLYSMCAGSLKKEGMSDFFEEKKADLKPLPTLKKESMVSDKKK